MAAPALTHHEIVRLVEPFARRGWQVDLVATDRLARRIVFKPREARLDDLPLVQGLALELGAEPVVLRRTLAAPGYPDAQLQARGATPAALLGRIEAVPAARHFAGGAGYRIARSYELGPEATQLVLSEARLQVNGMTLVLELSSPGLRHQAADLTLLAPEEARPNLPEDLLAVLGWDWARLVTTDDGWKSKLRLRGHALRRSRTAEAALEQAGVHLARVLAEPPAAFHERHGWARYGVVLRRAIPSLTAVGMVGGALALPYVTDPSHSGLWMALHYVPIAVLALSFTLQELPRFEIPPWPRRSRAPSWTATGPASATTRT